MPSIGEVKRASELGYNISKGHDTNCIYAMCTRCSRTRWVRSQDLRSGKGMLCRSCSHTTTKSFRNHIERVIEAGAKRASELGKPVFKNRNPWYYRHLCPICGKEVWHQRKDLKRACSPQCAHAFAGSHPRGKDHPNWKGGRYLRKDGYVAVQVLSDSPYHTMAFDKWGYVLEHRLIMAQHIGQCLLDSEVVHHVGTKYPQGSRENKSDNRIENLELLPNGASHLPSIRLQQQVAKLEQKVQNQEAKIRLLEWHIRELEHANPELAGSTDFRASVETLQEASPGGDEEKVHPHEKS